MTLDEIRKAIKNNNLPIYKIALEAGLKPTWVYQVNLGVLNPSPNDPRIKKLCEVMGLDNVDEN